MKFFDQVYNLVKKIPKGKVMTYGQIADMLGTKDARRVGEQRARLLAEGI